MINNYYILQDGQETGPYTLNELMDMQPVPSLMVLSPIADGWQEASDLAEFAQYFESVGIYVPTMQNMAGFWWRLLAYVIDYIIQLLIIFVLAAAAGVLLPLLGMSTGFLTDDGDDPLSKFYTKLFALVFNILYHATCEASNMRGSIGKLILRLSVVDADGNKLGFDKALSRNLGKILSALIIGIGYLNILWDDHKQAWHDQWAKTYVIRRPA
jgi:uncharacterized RDD family membrane protein YckC